MYNIMPKFKTKPSLGRCKQQK